MKSRKTSIAAPAVALAPLSPEELLGCRGGGDYENWLWQLFPWGPPTSPIDPITGTGPTFPSPPM